MISLNQKTAVETILKGHSLRKTAARVATLSIIAERLTAVSLPVLKRKVKISRITLYKTLRTLETKQIVYRVFNQQGEAHYTLRELDRTTTNLLLHFNCRICKKIYRLAGSTVTPMTGVEGFEMHSAMLCGVGVCRSCSKKAAAKR
jgi:Fur family ferric uptake transcriptional regulator